MRVAVCSIFRNSADYLDRYYDQLNRLRETHVFDIMPVLTEGDSTDDTVKDMAFHNARWVVDWYRAPVVHHVNHGGPAFGSVDNWMRWQQIAQVVRPTVAAALDWKPDTVVWVESDLLWETEVMMQLIMSTHVPNRTSAPMLLADGSTRFYDTWGYRLEGKGFLPNEPYFPVDVTPWKSAEGLVHIDSCGSCFATSDLKSLADWDGMWPYWGGGNIKLHTDLTVRHP